MSPLLKWKSNIWKNIRELKADNKKSGTAKGANWKERPMKQIIAISLAAAMPKMSKEMKEHKMKGMDKEKKVEKKEYKKGKK